MSYTYKFVNPRVFPYKTTIRKTHGQYVETSQPMGSFGFRYAVFRTPYKFFYVPVHDLTEETKQAIAHADGKGGGK
jgi:hypothetical protein